RPAGTNVRGSKSAKPGSIATAVTDVSGLLSPQTDMKSMFFETLVADHLPDVPLSQEELTQVLLNLVMNAADACDKRGRVKICAELADNGVEVSVEDDGPGVADEVKESLFEPFVSTKDVGKGTGLGLAVTRGLVESAGGTVRLTSGTLG